MITRILRATRMHGIKPKHMVIKQMAVLFALSGAGVAHGATFTVTNTGDTGGACAAACSLREAILAANAAGAGPHDINFAIPGAGVHSIAIGTALPGISEETSVNGYSQAGATANTLAIGNDANIEVEVSCTAGGYDALSIVTNDVTIRGLSIVNCRSAIFSADGTSGHVIAGNFIGTQPDGTAAGNARGITADNTSTSMIGGPSVADRNIISNSTNWGIRINLGGSNNTVQGNYVGLNPAGTAAHSNGGFGLEIQGGATSGNIFDSNVISASQEGIRLNAPSNFVTNNFIGTDATGTVAIPNATDGLHLRSPAGMNTVTGNLLSGNTQRGILMNQGTADNTIQGNMIGTDITGTVALPNGGGINCVFCSDNLVGGPGVGEGNLLSGNTGPGVRFAAGGSPTTGNTITGNLIGTDITGTNAIPNNFGVVIQAGGSPVTTTVVSMNTISGNITAGVRVAGANTAGQGNVIVDNVIGSDVNGENRIPNGDGILFETDSGAQVQNNKIVFNSNAGVTLTGASSSFESNSDNNCVVFNNEGVDNQSGSNTVFENNWWGDPSGPSGFAGGIGDSVSAGVDFDPFLSDPPIGCLVSTPAQVPTLSLTSLGVLMLSLIGLAGLIQRRRH